MCFVCGVIFMDSFKVLENLNVSSFCDYCVDILVEIFYCRSFLLLKSLMLVIGMFLWVLINLLVFFL